MRHLVDELAKALHHRRTVRRVDVWSVLGKRDRLCALSNATRTVAKTGSQESQPECHSAWKSQIDALCTQLELYVL